jgi:transposase
MIEPYSQDLRERAIRLLAGGMSSPEVAKMLLVSESWARKMRLRLKRLGHLRPSSPPGRERKLRTDDVVALGFLVDSQPDATLDELVGLMAKQRNVRVSISTISRRLIELGLTRKKSRSTPVKPTSRRSSKSATGFSGGVSSAARGA